MGVEYFVTFFLLSLNSLDDYANFLPKSDARVLGGRSHQKMNMHPLSYMVWWWCRNRYLDRLTHSEYLVIERIRIYESNRMFLAVVDYAAT